MLRPPGHLGLELAYIGAHHSIGPCHGVLSRSRSWIGLFLPLPHLHDGSDKSEVLRGAFVAAPSAQCPEPIYPSSLCFCAARSRYTGELAGHLHIAGPSRQKIALDGQSPHGQDRAVLIAGCSSQYDSQHGKVEKCLHLTLVPFKRCMYELP